MVVPIDIDVFEDSLVAWFKRVTGRPVGLADLPEETPNMPYIVLTPIILGRGEGTWADPECMRDYVFQILSVGKSPRQTRWMAERARQMWAGRRADGNHLTEMVGIEGATVLPGSRQSDSLGAVLKAPEGKLFQIIDTYRAKVE